MEDDIRPGVAVVLSEAIPASGRESHSSTSTLGPIRHEDAGSIHSRHSISSQRNEEPKAVRAVAFSLDVQSIHSRQSVGSVDSSSLHPNRALGSISSVSRDAKPSGSPATKAKAIYASPEEMSAILQAIKDKKEGRAPAVTAPATQASSGQIVSDV